MALTECPSCGKKISDKAAECHHCEFKVGDASADDLLRKQNLTRFKKLHSLQNQSMLAMLMFIAGFGFMYWGGTKPGDLQHNLAILASVVGFVWYIVNRVRIVIIKRFSS
ncbi:zinc ribbon domain-containing protein [Alteromonas aestuariivivens]|uniref:Zinc ribbon domain-containing protein n=1 Tax=Alteromonas aestuariivivens TaxID=1938339 RepID=A0A3D8M8C2_9ALTE|nr:zinc ribbon domain-containing protein [Alteromonas aestuariivivens]RDV26141.1 zinc ribbon domain-containing protein [Alteromonas aestuariivivens]